MLLIMKGLFCICLTAAVRKWQMMVPNSNLDKNGISWKHPSRRALASHWTLIANKVSQDSFRSHTKSNLQHKIMMITGLFSININFLHMTGRMESMAQYFPNSGFTFRFKSRTYADYGWPDSSVIDTMDTHFCSWNLNLK